MVHYHVDVIDKLVCAYITHEAVSYIALMEYESLSSPSCWTLAILITFDGVDGTGAIIITKTATASREASKVVATPHCSRIHGCLPKMVLQKRQSVSKSPSFHDLQNRKR